MKIVENKITSTRKNVIIIIIVCIFLILVFRMYSLQIIQYHKYVGIANSNRIRIVPTEAPRGLIYDRNGQIIADNIFQYNINVIPFEFIKIVKVVKKLPSI